MIEQKYKTHDCDQEFYSCEIEQRPHPISGEMEEVRIYKNTPNSIGAMAFYSLDKNSKPCPYPNRQHLLYITDPDKINFKAFYEDGALQATSRSRYKDNGDEEDGIYTVTSLGRDGKVVYVGEGVFINDRADGKFTYTFPEPGGNVVSVLECAFAKGIGQGLGYRYDADGRLGAYEIYKDGSCLQNIVRDQKLPPIYREVKENKDDLTQAMPLTKKELYLQAADELMTVAAEMRRAGLLHAEVTSAAMAAVVMRELALSS